MIAELDYVGHGPTCKAAGRHWNGSRRLGVTLVHPLGGRGVLEFYLGLPLPSGVTCRLRRGRYSRTHSLPMVCERWSTIRASLVWPGETEDGIVASLHSMPSPRPQLTRAGGWSGGSLSPSHSCVVLKTYYPAPPVHTHRPPTHRSLSTVALGRYSIPFPRTLAPR